MPEDCRPTILVVDDDAQTRSLMRTTLAGADFRVLEAKSGLDGIAAMLRFEGEIALAVVEIHLPGIGGLDLANQIGIERPTTEMLYVSGLVDSVAAKSIALNEPAGVLFKPFTAAKLLARVQELISRRVASADSTLAR
jgi:DNA-binding response OmpR family regulator